MQIVQNKYGNGFYPQGIVCLKSQKKWRDMDHSKELIFEKKEKL